MPKENGPFFAALCCGNVLASSLLTECAEDCYKCVRWTGNSCVECVYDESFCSSIIDPVCAGDSQWDAASGKCLCPTDRAKICSGVWEYYDASDNVCDCVEMECPSGLYAARAGVCENCPTPDWTMQSSCIIASDKTLAGEASNGCYIAAGCTGSDDKGIFEIVSDCTYSSL